MTWGSRLRASLAEREAAPLFAAALALRAAWTAWTIRTGAWADYSWYDDVLHWNWALAFLGRGPDVPTHPPGYGFFLVPFAIFGEAGLVASRLLQPVLGAAMAPATFRLGLSLGLERRAALAAGAWVACDPLLVYFSSHGSTEIPFSLLALYFFAAWHRAWVTGSPRRAAWAGLLGAGASLTRGVLLPFGALLAATAWLRRREQPRWAVAVAACGLVWAAAMAPWTLRNWRRHGAFIPVSVQGGWNLYEGLTLDLAEITRSRPEAMAREVREMGVAGPIAVDRYFREKARAWIRAHPLRFLGLCARKAVKFWRVAPYPPHGTAARWAAGAFHLALFACALAGTRPLAALPGSAFLFAWAAHLTFLHSVFASNMRYRLPLHFAVALAAGIGALRLAAARPRGGLR